MAACKALVALDTNSSKPSSQDVVQRTRRGHEDGRGCHRQGRSPEARPVIHPAAIPGLLALYGSLDMWLSCLASRRLDRFGTPLRFGARPASPASSGWSVLFCNYHFCTDLA